MADNINLGYMTPANLAGQHENRRLLLAHYAQGRKAAARAKHPSSQSSGRVAEFVQQAMSHEAMEYGHRANMVSSAMTVSPAGKMQGRSANFEADRNNFENN